MGGGPSSSCEQRRWKCCGLSTGRHLPLPRHWGASLTLHRWWDQIRSDCIRFINLQICIAKGSSWSRCWRWWWCQFGKYIIGGLWLWWGWWGIPFENEDEDALNTRGHKFLVLQRNCETERKTSSAFQADTSVGVDGDRSGQTYLLPCFGRTGEKVKSGPQKLLLTFALQTLYLEET